MITVREACLLGAIQGLTEFLPVSSSGHLAVAHQWLTPLAPAETAAVDVALHVGTLVAVLIYFRADIAAMLRALVRPGPPAWPRRWAWLLAVATVPAAMVGLALESRIEASFHSMPTVGVCFLLTGTLLWWAGRVPSRTGDEDAVGVRAALIVGCFQALALFPGVSRSGATIAGGFFQQLRDDVAARFAFLLGIPAIVGAEVSQLPTLRGIGSDGHAALAAGTAVAAVTGLAAIWGLMRLVRADRLHCFAYYLWPLGTIVVGTSVVGG